MKDKEVIDEIQKEIRKSEDEKLSFETMKARYKKLEASNNYNIQFSIITPTNTAQSLSNTIVLGCYELLVNYSKLRDETGCKAHNEHIDMLIENLNRFKITNIN